MNENTVTSNENNYELPFYVAIGASAGGLEAIRNLLSHLPTDLNCTYIIASHMSPDKKSLLGEILSRETKLPVLSIEDKTQPEKGKIYIVPPGFDVLVKENLLYLVKPGNTITPKPSIDRLFFSLADNCHEKAVGIVLSGTGSDGSQGLKLIRSLGGISIAQLPESAKFDSMPQSAISIGGADFIYSPKEIAEKLSDLITFPLSKTKEIAEKLTPTSLSVILEEVSKSVKIDFHNYKEPTLARQIIRRMTALNIDSIVEYHNYLTIKKNEVSILSNQFLICVTSFFRDPESFESLKIHLYGLLDKKQKNDTVRVWVPACATGEEAYTIGIIILEYLEVYKKNLRVSIFATDINLDSITTGRAGSFHESALAELNENLIYKYFVHEGENYVVGKNLKDIILFAKHNIAKDPPFLKLDMVSCRNLLIYLKSEVQQKLMSVFHYSLNYDGILFLGNSESIGTSTNLFQEQDRRNRIFFKRKSLNQETSARVNFKKSNQIKQIHDFELKKLESEKVVVPKKGLELLTELYAPPSLLITESGDILELFGDCSKFISLKIGKANFNLFSLIHPKLASDLRLSVYKASKNKKHIISRAIDIGEKKSYKISIHLTDSESSSTLMVSFLELEKRSSKNSKQIINNEKLVYIEELEKQLKENQENLQTLIEEMETSNEELQSLNEEFQATNEEIGRAHV